MSLHRFFLKDQVLSQETEEVFCLRLCDEDVRHAKVLRLREGEHIAVVDASSDYFECEICSMDGGISVRIARRCELETAPFDVVLVQGVAKGDKMDSIVRHATEIGVSEIVPALFARSVVKLNSANALKKQSRWQSIAKSAAMQSGRMDIPAIAAPSEIESICASLSSADRVLVFWEEAAPTDTISAALESIKSIENATVAVVVGPEGGLDKKEIELILRTCGNAKVVTLGDTILRTETAALIASALTIYELGGLGFGVTHA